MLNDVQDRIIQPFHELAKNELVCHIRKTPMVLYGIFTELLQQFWSEGQRTRVMIDGKEEKLFGTPDIHWHPDPNKTQLWIDTELRWESEHPEFRPAIYIRLSPIQYGTLNGSKTGHVRTDVQEAEYKYARTGTGTVSFVHVGSTPGEACALCDATENYLDVFSPVITDDFCFDWFKANSRDSLKEMSKDSKEKYGSVVTFDYRFTDEWILKMETPKLKEFVIRTSQSVGKRLEVGDYWDFKPSDGGLGLPPELEARAKKVVAAPIV